METLLGRRVRVTLTDGRVLLGRLHCLDWKKNLLIRDAYSRSIHDISFGDSSPKDKYLGLVAVEAKDVVKYEGERLGPP